MPVPDRDYKLEEVLKAFRRDGSLIREKARVLTEEGLEYLYQRMVQEDLSTSAFLDIMKYLSEIGDLKPTKSSDPNAPKSPQFSITINIPQADGKPPITLDAHAVDVPTEESDGVMGEVPLTEVPVKLLGNIAVNKDLQGEAE